MRRIKLTNTPIEPVEDELLERFIAELERDWSPFNKGKLVSRVDYERAWARVPNTLETRSARVAGLERDIEAKKARIIELRKALDDAKYRIGCLERDLEIRNVRLARLGGV